MRWWSGLSPSATVHDKKTDDQENEGSKQLEVKVGVGDTRSEIAVLHYRLMPGNCRVRRHRLPPKYQLLAQKVGEYLKDEITKTT